jgi:hypothetical protein
MWYVISFCFMMGLYINKLGWYDEFSKSLFWNFHLITWKLGKFLKFIMRFEATCYLFCKYDQEISIQKIHGTTFIYFYFFVLLNKNDSSHQLCMHRNLQCNKFVWYIIISLVYLKETGFFLSWVNVKHLHLVCDWLRAMSD